MKRVIRKVAVLGSGVMGSRIACHFANANVPVILLDIAPNDSNISDSTQVRNKVVNDALQQTLKSNPSAVFNKAKAKLIQTGNFDDDLSCLQPHRGDIFVAAGEKMNRAP